MFVTLESIAIHSIAESPRFCPISPSYMHRLLRSCLTWLCSLSRCRVIAREYMVRSFVFFLLKQTHCLKSRPVLEELLRFTDHLQRHISPFGAHGVYCFNAGIVSSSVGGRCLQTSWKHPTTRLPRSSAMSIRPAAELRFVT